MTDEIVKPTHHGFKNIEGQKFGRLLVTRYAGKRREATIWECQCDCGESVSVTAGNLMSGHTQSCGCIRREVSATRPRPKLNRHRQTFRAWRSMKDRCQNPNSERFEDYGGRGITVCQQWLDSYEAFLADMGECPSAEHSIDRKQNDGNYEPGNCRWATAEEQCNNRRNNVRFSFYGMDKTVSEWSRISQVKISTILERLGRGWAPRDAVWTPVKREVPHAAV